MSLNEYSGMRLRLVLAAVVAGLGFVAGCRQTCPCLYGDETPPAFTFVQMCDTQLGMGGYAHDVATFKQAVAQINALKPDFVAICGDLVQDADEASFADFNAIRATFAVPCHCVAGNHDVGNVPTTNSLAYYREKIGTDYYAFTHKGCRFVVSNTELWKTWVPGESDRHDAWFRKTLAEAKAAGQPVYVFGHHPPFDQAPDEPETYSNLSPGRRQALFKLYREHGVVAVLSGHLHRTVVREHEGVLYVAGETTSRNFDKGIIGYRVWRVAGSNVISHAPVEVKVDVAAGR